ncbi:MAG: site-specific DNA-methyltransferase [Crenarchaeota archaeon]|nr:site-specific DNA-methyltransferase [Thermoproteota archaeon]
MCMRKISTLHQVIFGSSQQMPEVADASIHLMLTSPPYPMIQMWDQTFAQTDLEIAKLFKKLDVACSEEVITQLYDKMHNNLTQVWKETYRVLIEGGIACINIGDATRSINGKFRLFPNHARIIEHMEKIGFTTLPYILWKKPTTKPKYKGKGAFLGSGFLPPNAYVTLDCEYILLFRKGKLRHFPPKDPNRYSSALTKKQRDEWFTQIWTVTGTRQTNTDLERRTGAYPEEIADRLIRMFSVKGDTVLDPFVGSGTTVKVSIQNKRNSITYEIDQNLLPIITKKVATKSKTSTIKVIHR